MPCTCRDCVADRRQRRQWWTLTITLLGVGLVVGWMLVERWMR